MVFLCKDVKGVFFVNQKYKNSTDTILAAVQEEWTMIPQENYR